VLPRSLRLTAFPKGPRSTAKKDGQCVCMRVWVCVHPSVCACLCVLCGVQYVRCCRLCPDMCDGLLVCVRMCVCVCLYKCACVFARRRFVLQNLRIAMLNRCVRVCALGLGLHT